MTSACGLSLFSEESVLLLPGQCFGAFGYARVVLTCPTKMLTEAWDRIEAFCQRKATQGSSSYTIVEGDVMYLRAEFVEEDAR